MNDIRDLLRDLWRSGVRVQILPDRLRLVPLGVASEPLKLALHENLAAVRAVLGRLPAPDRCQVCGEVTRGSAGSDDRILCVTCASIASASPATSCGPPEAAGRVDDAFIAASCARRDPRPDLEEDADLWNRLLSKAWTVDGNDPAGLYGALLGLRSLGGRLESRVQHLHLVHGEILPADYTAMRTEYLVTHTDHLVRLLRSAAAEPGR